MGTAPCSSPLGSSSQSSSRHAAAHQSRLGSLSNSAMGAQKPPGPCPSHSALHEHFPVIPEPIREYIEEVKAQLEEVTLSPGGLHAC